MKVINKGKGAVKIVNVLMGEGVKYYGFVNLYGCEIRDDTKIGTFVEIQKGAERGKRCKISFYTFIWEGVEIEDKVFIGHNVTFINNKNPRSTNQEGSMQSKKDWTLLKTIVKKGDSSRSSVFILGGISIEEEVIVGASSCAKVLNKIGENEIL